MIHELWVLKENGALEWYLLNHNGATTFINNCPKGIANPQNRHRKVTTIF